MMTSAIQIVRGPGQKLICTVAQTQRTETMFERMRGLLGADALSPDTGLWINSCNSVHSFFMSFTIDVLYLDKNNELADPKYGIIAKAFGSYINKKTDLRKVNAAKKWISGFVDWNLVKPIVNDVFPKEMKLKRWIEVGEVCEIEGKPLKFEDAIGCHIVPVDEDGKIEYDNLLISNHSHNKKMGTMNALKYKELWSKGEIV